MQEQPQKTVGAELGFETSLSTCPKQLCWGTVKTIRSFYCSCISSEICDTCISFKGYDGGNLASSLHLLQEANLTFLSFTLDSMLSTIFQKQKVWHLIDLFFDIWFKFSKIKVLLQNHKISFYSCSNDFF